CPRKEKYSLISLSLRRRRRQVADSSWTYHAILPCLWWTSSTSTSCVRGWSRRTFPRSLACWRHGMEQERLPLVWLIPIRGSPPLGSASCCPHTAPPTPWRI